MGSAAITLQMQPTGTAYVKAMQGSSWPQMIIAIFQDTNGNPVDLTGCVPRIFAGPNGAFTDGTVMDAFSGTAQFGVTPDMTAVPGQYACSFSLPNTSYMDFKVDRLTLKVVLQQDGIYYAFLNQVPGANEDIQTQLNNIRDELLSKVTEQDIQTAIGGITIGAVQLLPNSATLPTLHGWSQTSSIAPTDEGGGFYRLPLNSNVAEILQNTSVATIHGATYTESFYFRTDSTTLGFSFDFYESNNVKDNIIQATIQNLGSGLFRAYATATVGDTAIRAIDIKDLVYTDGTYIDIGKPKFEYGNKATDYSEADADFNDQIGTINQTLQTHTSEISQNAQDITLRVLTSTYNNYTAANDSAVSSLNTRVSSAEQKITDSAIVTTVTSSTQWNTLSGTASGAASAASSAQSTASNAASAAASAQSIANSKAKVFTSQPSPPYAAGDVWKNSSAVYVCLTARSSGSFTASDWSLSGDVTANNTAADTAKVGGTASATVLNNINTAQTAASNAEGAASTAQSTANSAASAASTAQSTAANAASTASTAQSTANSAASAASTAQSTANSKAKVFTSQPVPPYSIGDLWTNSAGDTMVCKTARSSGSFTASDWQPASAVTVTRIETAEQKITPQAITSTVASNITGDQIASIINQSATTVTISAQKLNLAGYITATSLSAAGATTINGANITTGTISADRIDTTNLKAQRIYSTTNDYYAQIGSHDMHVANEQGEQYQLTFTGISLCNNTSIEGGIYAVQDYNIELGQNETYMRLLPADGDGCIATLATTGAANYMFFNCNSNAQSGSPTVSSASIKIGSNTTHYGEGIELSAASSNSDGSNSKSANIDITPDNGVRFLNTNVSGIVDHVSNANGEAWKFGDGLMICTTTLSGTASYSSAFGSMYETRIGTSQSWPCAFVSITGVSATPLGTASFIESIQCDANGLYPFYVCRPVSGTTSYCFSIVAIGRWK